MTSAASSKDPLGELAQSAACSPLALLAHAVERLSGVAQDGEKQLTMARNLGRVAMRAARSQHEREKGPRAQVADDKSSTAAVEGYGALTAPEAIAIVRSADRATLRWIRAHETENKRRVTVIRALDARDNHV